ncbi:MAG: hypothetical protein IBJ14_00215 [Hydrogenophaga sp.]|nr:hypothetical protein [Hydrogenophaga sp.]
MKKFLRADRSNLERPLLQRKLQLEIERLSSDARLAILESDLRVQKTQLEIKGLRRKPWLQPGTIIPILATVGTIGLAWQQGVFDVQRKLLEIEGKEIVVRNRDLAEQEKALAASLEVLNADRSKLAQEKHLLSAQRASLRVEVNALQDDLTRAKRDEEVARARAVGLESTLATFYGRIRLLALGDVLIEISKACDTNNHPQRGHVSQNDQSNEVLQLDSIGADIVFPRSIQQCVHEALSRSRFVNELSAKDRSVLDGHIAKVAEWLERSRLRAMQAYAHWHSLSIDNAHLLPNDVFGYIPSLPPNLNEVQAFKWRVRNFKVREVTMYNDALQGAMGQLYGTKWPED